MGMDMDDLLEQLMKALDFSDPNLREKLKRGLEEGLDQLDLGTADLHFELDIDGDGVRFSSSDTPEVTVLDGGLDGDRPDTDERPDLEVVDGDALDDEDDDDDHPDISVEVLRSPFRRFPRGGRREGRILVDGQQTLFRGAEPRAYRLRCDDGELRVVVDGAAIEALAPGQTIDVEAALIQVRGQGEGGYRRL